MDQNTKILLVVVAVLTVLVLLHNRNSKTEGFQDKIATSADFIIDNVEFKSDNNLIKTTVMPVGTIIAWYGDSAKLPTGWVKCDGTNDTPDLRGRTVVGVGQYSNLQTKEDKFFAFKEKAGEMEHTLSADEMPSHGHKTRGGIRHVAAGWQIILEKGAKNQVLNPGSDTASGVLPAGGREVKDADGNPMKDAAGNILYETVPHNNMQPYVALHYIMYKGV